MMLQSLTIDDQLSRAPHLHPLHPVGAVAARLAQRASAGEKPTLYVAQTSRRARDIVDLLRILAGDEAAAIFPRWDGFPGDGIPASAQAMGTRMSVLRWLRDRNNRPAIVVTTAAGLLRKVPPRKIWQELHLEFRQGETIDLKTIAERLSGLGYRIDERVDEPGEAAVRARVIDIFPAAAPRPCRIEHEDGQIRAIRSYDPASQRSVAQTSHLIVDPASEFVGDGEGADNARIAAHYRQPESLFDYLPDAEIIVEEGVDRRAQDFLTSIAEAQAEAARGVDFSADFLTQEAWSKQLASQLGAVVDDGGDEDENAHVPAFASEREPIRAVRAFAEPLIASGYRIVVAGPAGSSLNGWSRRIARSLAREVEDAADWDVVCAASSGSLLRLAVPILEGFVAHDQKVAVVTLRDLAGQRAPGGVVARARPFTRTDEAFGIGDAVVHLDHGVGILEGLETVSSGEEASEALRLRYADDAMLLVPMHEIGALWRYGGSAADVSLDKLKGDAWTQKRDAIVAEVARTAEKMVELIAQKRRQRCDPLRPDRLEFERFCARFAFELTPDQSNAVEAVLADLEAGSPMDRLVCGDVGFGKTEVALRAAAAAVFSGKQVAVAAPTTVLARQHFNLFEKRFARHGVQVAQLSRLATPAEAREVRAGLADGSIQIVVGTHAIAGKDVSFHDLGLVVIDEEQRFGARQKDKLRGLTHAVHVLAMTATPIPRTLQAGFVGLHDLSVIATPPVSRRPIRTNVVSIEDDAVGEALRAEKRRGGQSFVVCPRIEDLSSMQARLQAMVPELSVAVLHGELPAAEADEEMLRFATGQGDVLLATNIVESGLDVPGANTMVVYRPDRFGLAQLHQLRGRVGRGARRGIALLATDPKDKITETAAERLATLCEMNALGSGFDISARDLDLRGAGELLGDEQAGHLQMIGLSLYRRSLERALLVARGETPPDDWKPDLNLDLPSRIPADYVPEPERRIELALQLEQVGDEGGLDHLRSEIEDRFGPLPSELITSFALAALRLRCKELGVRKLDAGPQAVAASFSKAEAEALKTRIAPAEGEDLRWSNLRLVLRRETQGLSERLTVADELLDRIA